MPDCSLAAWKGRLWRALRGLGRCTVWMLGLGAANEALALLSRIAAVAQGGDVIAELGIDLQQQPQPPSPGLLETMQATGSISFGALARQGLLPEGQITEDGFRFLAFCSAAAVCVRLWYYVQLMLAFQLFLAKALDGLGPEVRASVMQRMPPMMSAPWSVGGCQAAAYLCLTLLAFWRPSLMLWLRVPMYAVAHFTWRYTDDVSNPVAHDISCLVILLAAACIAVGGTQPVREERAPSPQETAPKRRQQLADDGAPQGPCGALHGGVLLGGAVLNEGIMPLQMDPAARAPLQGAGGAAAPARASWLHEGLLPDGGVLQGGVLTPAPLPAAECGSVTVHLPQGAAAEGDEGKPDLQLGLQWRGDGVLMGVAAGSPAASCGAQHFIGRRLASIGDSRVPLDTVAHSVGAAAAAAAATEDRVLVLSFAPLRGPGLSLPHGWLQGADDADRQCRICLGGPESGTLIAPCLCIGSIKWVHSGCLDAWRERGQFYQNLTHCGQCKWRYRTGFDPGVSLTACGVRALIKHLPLVAFTVIVLGCFDLWGWLGYGHTGMGRKHPPSAQVAALWDNLGLWLSWDYMILHCQMGMLNLFSMLGVASVFAALWTLFVNGVYVHFRGTNDQSPGPGMIVLLVFFGVIYAVFLLWKASRDLYNKEKSMAKRYPVLELDDAEREQLRRAA